MTTPTGGLQLRPSGTAKQDALTPVQGAIRFAGAERIVREFVDGPPAETRVVLDLARVSSMDDVARRMLLELARRLTADGHDVSFVDPGPLIPSGGVVRGRHA